MPYPPIQPYEAGYLEVGDGHRIYWEACGQPQGIPALVLHGGPGSGCTGQAKLFDPDRYRIVLFDQRNCGRSTPHASASNIDLSTNTTDHLLRDIEQLREFLGIDRWVVWGGSWGSVLALTYAETFPERVRALVLVVMGLGRRLEVDLMTRGVGALFPKAYAPFTAFAAQSAVAGTVVDRYHDLLFHPDPAVQSEAARHWCDWEAAIVPTAPPSPRFSAPDYRLAFARLVTHYWRNDHFLAPNQILDNAHRLAGIPAVILQGRHDLWNLSGSPWELAARWPEAELEFFDSGHEGNDAMAARIIAATDRFARG